MNARIGAGSCASGFTQVPNTDRCLWFSDSILTHDAALSDCKSKTADEGYLAEMRSSQIYNFILANRKGVFRRTF